MEEENQGTSFPAFLTQALNLIDFEICFLNKQYDILWINKSKNNQRPHVVKGDKCYKSFGFNSPCSFCQAGKVNETGEPVTSAFCLLSQAYVKQAGHFNFTLAPLKNEQDEQIGYIEIIKNVEDIYQKHTELEYLNQEYEHVIYTLSHDLRSPLISIDGFIKKLIKVGQIDLQNGTVIHCLDRIQANISMMDNLIKVLLDTSRITSGELRVQHIDVNELVDTVVRNFSFMAEKAGVRILIKGSLGKIYGDPVRIGQVFNNLIANIFQHCSGTENLTIEIGHEKGIYWVKDNGPGISEHSLSRIFKSFTQGETHSKNSFGMGMNIVYKIIQKHYGRVWIDSAPNIGTTVYFTFNTEFLV